MATAAPARTPDQADAGGVPRGLAFIDDDVPRALAEAKTRKKALFVDAWAPWCHTCLSMKHYVLDDPALLPLADRVVFAAIDTDREQNAKFLETHAVNVWPTFFVIDPDTDKVVGLWPGSASLGEMRSFIEDSLGALEALKQGGLPAGSALSFLIAAKEAQASGDHPRAAKLYESALAKSQPDWPRRNEVLANWMKSLFDAHLAGPCVDTGLKYAAEIQGAVHPASFASYLFECAKGLRDPQKQRAARAAAIRRLRELTDDPPRESSADDRSDALDMLSGMLHDTGDRTGARALQERRLELMEKAAAAAPTPQAASTYDYGRANAYVALGRAEDAVRMLEQRERELPGSYEPSARLAGVLAHLKRWQPALAAIDRALAQAYGPRKLRYLELKAEIQAALGDHPGRIKTLEEEVAGREAAAAGRPSTALAEARRRLEAARKAGVR
jgi:tetratricopeptide (TPR) repeat protein